MRIFLPYSQEGFELVQPINQEDFERFSLQINGQKQASVWTPISMKLIHADLGVQLRESDAPWLGSHALIFRKRVVESLRSILNMEGEFLPLTCHAAEVFVYNPNNLIDCLDEETSEVLRFSNGRIMYIKKHVFRTDLLRGVATFKIPNLRVSPTYLTERFVDKWISEGFSGLRFDQIQ